MLRNAQGIPYNYLTKNGQNDKIVMKYFPWLVLTAITGHNVDIKIALLYFQVGLYSEYSQHTVWQYMTNGR